MQTSSHRLPTFAQSSRLPSNSYLGGRLHESHPAALMATHAPSTRERPQAATSLTSTKSDLPRRSCADSLHQSLSTLRRGERGSTDAARETTANKHLGEAEGSYAHCRMCQRDWAPGLTGHECQPVCFVPPCEGKRFPNENEFEIHNERRHPIAYVYPEHGRFMVGNGEDGKGNKVLLFPCPVCKKTFEDVKIFQAHVEKSCPEALAKWMENTTIVK